MSSYIQAIEAAGFQNDEFEQALALKAGIDAGTATDEQKLAWHAGRFGEKFKRFSELRGQQLTEQRRVEQAAKAEPDANDPDGEIAEYLHSMAESRRRRRPVPSDTRVIFDPATNTHRRLNADGTDAAGEQHRRSSGRGLSRIARALGN